MLATLLTVAVLHWVVLVTPGANVLLVSQLAASGHRRSAYFAGFGVSVVALGWALLAVLGVNAAFAAWPAGRLLLQVAGGAYLVWVAWRLWRSGASAAAARGGAIGAWASFRLGFLTNVMNPKSALFFGSVFATALPASTAGAPDTALSAAAVVLVFANALVWHSALAAAFSHPRIQAGYARQRVLLNRAAAAIVGAIGLRLLVATLHEVRQR